MAGNELDDYRWLIGPDGAACLASADRAAERLVAVTARLRRELSPERVHLVLEQVDLRRRAADKFDDAPRMFFTGRALQQSSGQAVARWKAGRFSTGRPLADLCCGIGGDLVALASHGPALGVDRDPIVALLARANCEASGVRADLHVADVEPRHVESVAAWHADPDRRRQGRRTTRPDAHEPGVDVMDRLLGACGNAAIKLAPAAEVPRSWAARAECEWIGHRRECKQLVVWFGRLAKHPGRRSATVLAGTQGESATIVGSEDERVPCAERIGRYVFEPDAAVLAARLTGTLAARHGVAAVAHGIAYLTGDVRIADPLLAAFEVDQVMPLDMKRVRAALRARNVGRLEIKRRGVPIDPATARKQLHPRGPESATVILTRRGTASIAILARRVPAQPA